MLAAASRSEAAKRLEGITTTEALAGSAGPALAQRAAPQRAAPDSGAAGQNNPVTASRLTVGPDTYYEVGWADTLNGAYSYSLHLTGVSQYTLPTLVARDTYDWQAYTCTGGGCIASPVWSFTMAVPPPTAPQPSQPTDGATGVQNPVTLSWLAAGADSDYQVAYDDTTAGSGYTSPIDVGIQTSYAMPSLAAGHTFNWLAYGCTSFCVGGTISSFTMYAPQPGIPQLSAPANGVTNVGVTPTLSWFSAANAVAGVTYYQIGLWDGQTTAQIGGNLITTDPTTQVQAPAGQGLVLGRSYWWAVSACSPQLCTNWSSFWLFTTVPAPGAAAQQSPPNDATGVGASPTLSWAAPTSDDYAGETHYYVFLYDTVTQYQLPAYDAGTSLSQAVGGLAVADSYQWQVVSCNGAHTNQDCTYDATWDTFDTGQRGRQRASLPGVHDHLVRPVEQSRRRVSARLRLDTDVPERHIARRAAPDSRFRRADF